MKNILLLCSSLFMLNISALCAGKKPETVDTSNWKVYVDKTIGYEVKYPSDVKTSEYPDNNVIYDYDPINIFVIELDITGKGFNKIYWRIRLQSYLNPDKIPAKGWFYNLPSAPGDEDIPFDRDEPIRINNTEGHLYAYGGNEEFVFVVFAKNNKIVSLEYSKKAQHDPETSQKMVPIYEAILHSFRWIETEKEQTP